MIGHFKIKKEKRVWLICYRSDQSQTSGQPRRQGHELATVETGEHLRVAITSSRGAPAWRRGQAQEAGPWRPRLCSAAAATAHRQPSCHRLRLPPAGHSPTTKRIPSSQRGQRMLGGSVAGADAWACKLQSREKKRKISTRRRCPRGLASNHSDMSATLHTLNRLGISNHRTHHHKKWHAASQSC